jgi:RNA polymerase sigma-70 factor (ECF subfamily)
MPRSPDDYARQILHLEKFLRAYLHRFAPQPADIEDLLQETYSHLFKLTPAQRAAITNVQGFAVRSARNVAMDWIRHRQVISIESIEELTDLPVIEDAERLEEIAHTHQQLVKVARGIAGLPERCRQVFTLRRVYGLTQKEIAARLGIAEGTVEQQLVKGMRRCAEILRQQDGSADPRGRPREGITWTAGKKGDKG